MNTPQNPSQTLKVRLNASQDYNGVIQYYASRPGCVGFTCKRFVHVTPAPSEPIIDRAPLLEAFVHQSAFLSPGENAADVQFLSRESYEKTAKETGTKGCMYWILGFAWLVLFVGLGMVFMLKEESNMILWGVFKGIGLAPPIGFACYFAEYHDRRKKGGEEYCWELVPSEPI